MISERPEFLPEINDAQPDGLNLEIPTTMLLDAARALHEVVTGSMASLSITQRTQLDYESTSLSNVAGFSEVRRSGKTCSHSDISPLQTAAKSTLLVVQYPCYANPAQGLSGL
ncbi:hypothetical protein CC1G_15195 [Coprinopsis cinerea okayama7|uniref:Uncharacterized protein n=1 Tax=Coprinopsis cinerea (strain Okayama-7 / 130 / ATCC MYA-4618 / FGSC 9003) TaxID=240176 RepID=D6RPQ9_COPC7|nr:hypothetical protein CC1G_15195 [Coprinopsis cinerea okayama7\|eukprot:XP_002910560.1 hypothetical protein CC1G_15195 [Coprinopsis cinerea okayama7\